MTRWARAGNSQRHQKIPGEATKWGEFDLQKVENGSAPKNKNKTELNSKSNVTDSSPRKNVNKIKKQKNKKKRSHVMSNDGGRFENKIHASSSTTSEIFLEHSQNKTENVERSHQQQNISAEKTQTKKRKRDQQKDGHSLNSEASTSKTFSPRKNVNKIKKQKNKKKRSQVVSDDGGRFENKIQNDASSSTISEIFLEHSQNETEDVEKSHQQQDISAEKTQTKKRKRDQQKDAHSLNSEASTSKTFENKKSTYLEKLQKRRAKNGILLLPVPVERRLYNIKRRLREKNIPAPAIVDIIRRERRKAELNFRKTFSPFKLCFNCRQPGHILADCPEKLGSSNQETGFCFKCGSKEHASFKCTEKVEGFPFAKCFICKEQGHISKDCPNNKHGVYPKGGKCNLCGNVNHLKKDCPTLSKKAYCESTVTLQMIDNASSIDAEVPEKTQRRRQNVKKPKIVKF